MAKASLKLLQETVLKGKTISEASKQFRSASAPFVDSATQSQSYKSFFADFDRESGASPGSGTPRITSFEEQKSFTQMLQFLNQATGANVMDHTIKPREFSLLSRTSYPVNLETRYSKRQDELRAIHQTLKPTWVWINENVGDSKHMYEFIMSNIIDKYQKSPAASLQHEEVSQLVKDDASNPPVNQFTLPVLLHFTVSSLINDFDSLELAHAIPQIIKSHANIDLYTKGMTIELYNLLLESSWRFRGDLHEIASLVTEMSVNALQGDLVTWRLISIIYLRVLNLGENVTGDSMNLVRRKDIRVLRQYLESTVVL